jgi:hypothetical protein
MMDDEFGTSNYCIHSKYKRFVIDSKLGRRQLNK